MANNCFYDLKAVGTKESLDELVQILQYEHPELRMYRIFSAEVYEEGINSNQDRYITACGDVAWSISSSMLRDISPEQEGVTNILTETARLGLVVEIFSSEPGIGFQEHYIIDRGEIQEEECVDYSEYWYDSSEWEGNSEEKKFASFCEEYGLEDISLKDLEYGRIYKVGGFSNYGEWSF